MLIRKKGKSRGKGSLLLCLCFRTSYTVGGVGFAQRRGACWSACSDLFFIIWGGKGGGIMLYIVICLFHEEDLVKERWRGNGYNGLFN